jgi:hypothetical protein
MSWGAQNRSKDAKTPSVAGVRSQKPELDCCPVQPYKYANKINYQLLVRVFNKIKIAPRWWRWWWEGGGRHCFAYNGSLELTAPQHTAVKAIAVVKSAIPTPAAQSLFFE